MKKKILAFIIMICLTSAPTVFARGYGGGGHGGYYRGGHRAHGLGIAFGVAGGLLLGTALLSAAAPPPPGTVVYGNPYPAYQPGVVVRQPRICLEDRIVNGEWQVSGYDGRQVWVSYPYPVIQTFQVPCY